MIIKSGFGKLEGCRLDTFGKGRLLEQDNAFTGKHLFHWQNKKILEKLR